MCLRQKFSGARNVIPVRPRLCAARSEPRSCLVWATLDGKRVNCAVSREALNDLTRSSHSQAEQLIEAYRSNISKIATVAERKARANWFEPDGSILVQTADVS
ncbi:DUF1488 family protein [Porphyrobacter sp. AAP82]|uniref:DUF1488 family protein n=1 Tax=Porphyrobacter sp. AAP82 TaxID=1248917 RepID=UPI0009D9C52D